MKLDEATSLIIAPMTTDDTVMVWSLVAVLVLSWALTLGILFKYGGNGTIQDDNR